MIQAPPDTSPFKYHFFVSYTGREVEVEQIKPYVEKLVHDLKQMGFTAWPFWLDIIQMGRFKSNAHSLKEALTVGMDESISMLAFTSPAVCEVRILHVRVRVFRHHKRRRAVHRRPTLEADQR